MKIGRNELCPCGSGKKYKKCCLDMESKTLSDNNDVKVDMFNDILNIREMCLERKPHIKDYYRLRQLHSDILNSMIDYFENGKYNLQTELKKATDAIKTELDNDMTKFKFEFKSNDERDLSTLYNLFIYNNHPNIASITKIYLEENKFKKKEKVKMLKAMNNSYAGIFKIVNCDFDNALVEIEDVTNGKRFEIVDISLSTGINVENVYIYNRIITYDNISFGTGLNLSFLLNDSKINNYIESHKDKRQTEFIRCLDLFHLSKSSNILINVRNIK